MTFTATYDGRTFVPDTPPGLPVGTPVTVTVADRLTDPAPSAPTNTLMDLLAELEKLPDNPNAPTDGSVNYKHYLYGLPKRS